MTSENSDKQEVKSSSLSLENEKNTAKKFIQGTAQSLIQWMPLGGSGITLISALLKQEWLQALITFPVMIVTVVWAAYTESFLKRLREVYEERGRQDVDKLITWQQRMSKSLTETIRWQLAGTDDKYLRCQGNECVQDKTEGLNSIFRPQLSDVFVSLELSKNFLRDSNSELLPRFPGFSSKRNIIQKNLSKEGLSIWDILKKAQKDSIYRSLIIQSWGGYGKTTLLRHITYIYSKKLEHKKPYNAPKLLPVLLYLRKWQELIAKPDAPDLPTLIEKHHIPDLPEGKALKLPPNWAVNHLHQGKMLIMLDGFDEVREEWRNFVSKWIGKQLKDYPKTFLILTSRPAGYRQYQSENKPNTLLFIKPFNEEQQERFLKQWYLSWDRHLSSEPEQPTVKVEALRKAASLFEQIKPKEGEKNPLSDFAKNPLLLNMIFNFHCCYPNEKLPQRRTELYRDIVRLQLGDRPLAKQINMPLEASESQKVLQSLALFMLQKSLSKLEPETLKKQLKSYLNSIDQSLSSDTFLEKIEQVSELLVKVGELYQFAHQSFQEYLAAVEIKDTQREDLLLQHYRESWWKETILLYIIQLRNPSSFIRRLTQIKTPEATTLAYESLKETPREIDLEVETELQSVSSTVQNARYQKLEKLLKNRQFKEADYETYRLMIETVGKEEGQWFHSEDFDNFPCKDLCTLDQLWIKYSDGKFGFSVQKKIYIHDLHGTKNYNEKIWKAFCNRVGWRKGGNYISYDDLTFELLDTTPVGHLPAMEGILMISGGGLEGSGYLVWGGFSLIHRLVSCSATR